jgi:hypothetical protein
MTSFCHLGSEEKPTPTSPEGKSHKKAMNLTVLSYDVRHCSPPANPSLIDVGAIANIIKDSKAELVGLQEIDVNNGRSGVNLDRQSWANWRECITTFPKELITRVGLMARRFCPKFPFSEQETIQLAAALDTEQRTLSVCGDGDFARWPKDTFCEHPSGFHSRRKSTGPSQGDQRKAEKNAPYRARLKRFNGMTSNTCAVPGH